MGLLNGSYDNHALRRLAEALPISTSVQSALDTAVAANIRRVAARFPALAAITGAAGEIALVLESDTGQHVELEFGGTDPVPNSGKYEYSAEPAGWKWLEPAEPLTLRVAALEHATTGGPLLAGQWIKLPAIYKLLLEGTGTVTIHTRASDGSIAAAAAIFEADGFVEEYPYFGPVVAVRATTTGTATAEIV